VPVIRRRANQTGTGSLESTACVVREGRDLISLSKVEKKSSCCENITQRVLQTRSLLLSSCKAREERKEFQLSCPPLPPNSPAQRFPQLEARSQQRPFEK